MPKTFKFLRWSGKKAVAFFVLTMILVTVTVGSTIAYVVVKTNELTNTFTPPNLDIDLSATSGNAITNTGDIPVYVRAAVVATYVNTANGTTLSTTPTVEITPNANWVKGNDGFFYYTLPINSDETVNLISSMSATSAPDGYELNVQILSTAIQATPITAVTSAWAAVTKVDSSGVLTIATN